MHSRRNLLLRSAFLVAAAGAGYLFSGCGPVDVGSFLVNVNPCGTILNCDPTQYRFLTSGYQGPGADPNIDPACTDPPRCTVDPFV